jgi:carbon monoxide dehydrogenase subunit G
MKMTETRDLPVSQEIAWNALNDISLLQLCIPGCESIEDKGNGEYELLITAAVGPIKAKFKGKMTLKDPSPPSSYTLDFAGQGGAVGYGRGQASVTLTALELDKTQLSYVVEASVGGKLAQVGARLIDMAAKKMAAEFFDAFVAQLTEKFNPGHGESQSESESDEKKPASERKIWSRPSTWLSKGTKKSDAQAG